MDPITTAIVAALSVGVMSGLTETGKQVIADAYDGLKALLMKKFGGQSEVVKSVANLEARPESSSRQGTLKEEVAAAHADQDPDLLEAAHILLKQIKAQSGGNNTSKTPSVATLHRRTEAVAPTSTSTALHRSTNGRRCG